MDIMLRLLACRVDETLRVAAKVTAKTLRQAELLGFDMDAVNKALSEYCEQEYTKYSQMDEKDILMEALEERIKEGKQ